MTRESMKARGRTLTGNRGRKASRLAVAAGVLAFLFLWVDSAPSVPAVPVSVPDPPDLERVAVLEELAAHLSGAPGTGHRLDARVRESLTRLMRSEPRRFRLFREHLDERAERQFLRTLPYGRFIGESARRYELDALLLAALVEAESSFLPDAVSPVGAVGLTQVMPATARWLGQPGDLKDPTANLEVGARYLRQLLDRFDGDLELALAAYNAGPTAVLRYGGVPPYRETRSYVRKVLSIYAGHNWKVWTTSGAKTAQLVQN